MSYRIPSPIIQNFLEHHTCPVALSKLPHDVRSCPICKASYVDRDPKYNHPLLLNDTEEYPVRICNCGECKHVFGRRCLEQHIRAQQPWSHRCPLCRAEFFPAPSPRREQLLERVERLLNMIAARDANDEAEAQQLDEIYVAAESIRDELLGPRWI
ncbi:hypothetical protein BDV96DRAFT_202838 [Lophiotrema nucula]|uniref:RING-type domain-containing protein n=1 Tax=Lophiotrema nucula TaxID=690887 RepID=A0A6A5YTJ8_9PLEO|nr:hypothetical protein BDV96DRAFT_202838 [Lophiotrema nucula]